MKFVVYNTANISGWEEENTLKNAVNVHSSKFIGSVPLSKGASLDVLYFIMAI